MNLAGKIQQNWFDGHADECEELAEALANALNVNQHMLYNALTNLDCLVNEHRLNKLVAAHRATYFAFITESN